MSGVCSSKLHTDIISDFPQCLNNEAEIGRCIIDFTFTAQLNILQNEPSRLLFLDLVAHAVEGLDAAVFVALLGQNGNCLHAMVRTCVNPKNV